jgi:hypothetical protein
MHLWFMWLGLMLLKIDYTTGFKAIVHLLSTVEPLPTYNQIIIKRWVDAHTNLPFGARWFALKQMWLTSEQPSRQRQPSPQRRVFLLSETAISPQLIQAYREADYRVNAEPAFVLKVGACSQPLALLFQRHQCDCAAYLTACNPLSEDVGAAENAVRQAELSRELKERSLRFIEGVGQDSQGEWPEQWPGEASFLVLGLSLEASRALGRKHAQNALIWCAKDAVPQLVLLR